jgi:hypothetical protein
MTDSVFGEKIALGHALFQIRLFLPQNDLWSFVHFPRNGHWNHSLMRHQSTMISIAFIALIALVSLQIILSCALLESLQLRLLWPQYL